MGKIIKLSLEEILYRTGLILDSEDISFFCEDQHIQEEFTKAVKDNDIKKGRDILVMADEEDIKNKVPNNERRINKERFVLLAIYNYKRNIETLDAKLKRIMQKDINEIDNEYLKISLDKEQQTQNLNEALSIGRGTEAVFPLFYYDTKTKKYNLEVIDSRTEIDGKKVRDNSKRRKFEKVDKELKELGFKGMENVLQAVLLTDLYSLLPSKKFGICLREKILTDEFIRQKLVDNDKLFKSGKVDMKEYLRACEEFNFEDALPYIKNQLKEYIDYIDLDRLFLISLYRLEAGLDTKIISANSQAGIELLMEVIYKNIPRDLSFSYLLEDAVQRNGELRKIEYSASDAQKCLKRFALNGKYLSKEEVKEYREGFFKGELSLYDIESDFVPSIFNSEELEKLIDLNDKNFYFFLEMADMDSKQREIEIVKRGKCETWILSKLFSMKKLDSKNLITLYENNVISLKQIQEMNFEFLENISIQKLIDLYKINIKENSTDKDKQDYEKYLDLCKLAMNHKQTDESKKAEASNTCMEIFIENFDEDRKDEYLKGIEEFYKAGLMNLETIVEWNSEEILIPLLDSKTIDIDNITKLVQNGKVSMNFLSCIYTKIISEEEIAYDERLKFIKTGLVLQEDIFKLYNDNLIYENDMELFVKMGIINRQAFNEVLRNKTMEQAEKQSAIVLKGLNTLTKRNNEIYDNSEYKINDSKKSKYIIDPNEREEFIKLFGAIEAQTDVEEDSPFYNYVFYAIPNEKGKVDLDSIVIAERYYEDKQTEERFAINNATYIFKYKDLMVLSRQKKSEMTQARKNIVYTANHTLATEEKDGHWAASTLFGITKAMISSNLDEYSEENKRKIIIEKMCSIYSKNEIDKILQKLGEIDSGKFTCEIINPNVTRRTIKNTPNHDDDGDEAR